MAKLKVTIACDKYDYLQPLREGRVEAEGIDVTQHRCLPVDLLR